MELLQMLISNKIVAVAVAKEIRYYSWKLPQAQPILLIQNNIHWNFIRRQFLFKCTSRSVEITPRV
jgi:hypothetical protein